MAIKPLTITAVAAVSLIAVLAIDATMNRTYALDLRHDGEWVTLLESAEGGSQYSEMARPFPILLTNETMQLRVRVENGYPWAFSERYEVRVNYRVAGEGLLQAPARGEGVAELTADASQRPPGETPPQKGTQTWVSIELTIGETTYYTGVNAEVAG